MLLVVTMSPVLYICPIVRCSLAESDTRMAECSLHHCAEATGLQSPHSSSAMVMDDAFRLRDHFGVDFHRTTPLWVLCSSPKQIQIEIMFHSTETQERRQDYHEQGHGTIALGPRLRPRLAHNTNCKHYLFSSICLIEYCAHVRMRSQYRSCWSEVQKNRRVNPNRRGQRERFVQF